MEKQVSTATSPTPPVDGTDDDKIKKELKIATHKASELGIEINHVTELKGADKMFAYASTAAITIDDATNRRLVRKIDLHVLPWLCGLYVLQYLDKGV